MGSSSIGTRLCLAHKDLRVRFPLAPPNFMGKLLLVIALISLLSACTSHEDELVRDFEMRIAQINYGNQMSGGKQSHLIGCNEVLFETITEPKKYVSIGTCDWIPYMEMRKSYWIYNHKVGDKVYFKYLRKDRFFDIREDLQPK